MSFILYCQIILTFFPSFLQSRTKLAAHKLICARRPELGFEPEKDKIEKPYKCDQCNSSHISKNSLHKHKSISHSDKKRLEELCKQCNRNIPKRLFNRHMEKVHNVPRYTFNIVKEGIFLSNTDRYFKGI